MNPFMEDDASDLKHNPFEDDATPNLANIEIVEVSPGTDSNRLRQRDCCQFPEILLQPPSDQFKEWRDPVEQQTVSHEESHATVNNPFGSSVFDKSPDVSNPFGDGDGDDGPSSNPFGDSEAVRKSELVLNRSSPVMNTHNKITFNKADLDYLVNQGFSSEMAKNALMTRSREQASDYLRDVSFKSAVPIWEAPLGIRVGSWLPNVLDQSSGEEHTLYFVSVVLLPINYSWQLSRRYAQFYDFYSTMKRDIAKAFPSGMRNPFPDDRFNAFVLGMSDKVRDKRKDGLNRWLQELLNAQNIILNRDALLKIQVFLEFEGNFTKKVMDAQVPPQKQVVSSSSPSTILTQAVSERFMKRKQPQSDTACK